MLLPSEIVIRKRGVVAFVGPMAGVKKPAEVVEDVQHQTTKKISHFLSRVPPLCGENTESKRKQMCKYMKFFVLCIYTYM